MSFKLNKKKPVKAGIRAMLEVEGTIEIEIEISGRDMRVCQLLDVS